MITGVVKTCDRCGAEFVAGVFNAHKARWCSTACRRAGYAASTTKKTHAFTCRNCGREYETPYLNRNQYCSRQCAFSDQGQWQKHPPQKGRQCASCGKPFTVPQSGHRSAKYCSEKCGRRGVAMVCEQCGRNYHGSPASKYCCGRCAYKANQEQKRRDYVPKPDFDKRCHWCGAEFTTNRPTVKYCGDQCSLKAFRASKRSGNHRRNVMKRRQFVARVNVADVYQRDGWACQICGSPVDPNAQYPDPMSASLDHIVPISRGGTHEPSNVRLTHWICNCVRGNRTLI